MPFKKGEKRIVKTGGRKPGTPNRTSSLRSLYERAKVDPPGELIKIATDPATDLDIRVDIWKFLVRMGWAVPRDKGTPEILKVEYRIGLPARDESPPATINGTAREAKK